MIRLKIAALAGLLGMVTVFGQSTMAGESSGNGGLSLGQAVARVLEHNPELKGSQFALKAAGSRVDQAALKPAPEVKLELENFAGSGVYEGTDALETTLILSQVIELGGKREKRRMAAEAGQNVAATDAAILKLDTVAEVARRFLHLVSDQERLVLALRATGLAEKTVEAVEQRVKAAKAPQVELLRARVSLTRAEIRQEHAEHEMTASRRKLAALWGSSEDDFGTAQADLLAIPRVTDFQALVAKLDNNPDIGRYLSEARLHEAEMNLAESRRRSNIEIGGGIRRQELNGDHAFVASVSMPLFANRRALPAIEEETARRQLAMARHESARINAQARLFALYQEFLHAWMEATTLREQVLPQMEEALKQTEYAYQRGRYSYLEWVDAQQELLEVNQRLIESAASAHLLLTEVERLTGQASALTEK